MTTDREVTRALRSWLHEDAHEDADRVLELVVDQLAMTPQRRTSWLSGWSSFVRLGLVAVLVAAVALIGLRFLPASNTGTPSSTETPSPQETTTTLPASAFPPRGDLGVGTASMTRWGVSFTFEAPASGWTSDGGPWLDRNRGTGADGAAMLFWNRPPTNVYADPCGGIALDPPAGASAGEMADAMSHVPGTDLASGPTDVTVGGYPAKRLQIVIRDDIPCVPHTFNLWYALGPGTSCGGVGECERWATGRGSTITVWIVDVRGVRIVIEGETYAGAGPEPAQEIQQVIDSITFE